ncbi:MAG TPA: S41 family peptidase [Bacteroidales bacterium]|nr:S41 family peptidase [Bacteroidales bacterium]
MKEITKYLLILLIPASIFVTGCQKEVEPDNDEPVPAEISRFIWDGLNDYYLWYKDVDKLSKDYFATTNDYYAYLNSYNTDYEQLFISLLYNLDVERRWSWIVDDYEALEQSFAGISKSMGYDWRLVNFSGTDNYFGFVRYVVPDSPADIAGIERGDYFLYVDGQQITGSNYYSLLVESDSYILTMATINGSTVSPNGITRNLTAVVLQENPIHYYSTLDIGGVKTAYLVYNSFNSEFDVELNDLFGTFKSEGVQRLILDMRYNGGGSILSAVYLASMIYSTNTNTIFSKRQYNDKVQAYLLSEYGADFFNYYFADKIDTITVTNPSPPDLPAINNLGITDLYVLTSTGTASASELVINGLEPFMNVTLIGENTYGKNVGSITVKDYYSRDGILNPDHKWAMQPIVLKIANSQDFSDYVNGLSPDVTVDEGFIDLLPFGDENELLLKAATDHILGLKSERAQPVYLEGVDYFVIADSRDFIPFSKDMYEKNSFILNK